MEKKACICSDTYIAMVGPCLSCPLLGPTFPAICKHEYSRDPNEDPDICMKCDQERED